MTTILPAERSSFDTIMSQLGQGLSQTLPQAAQQRSQRETGLSAIDQLQSALQNAGGDINKILPAYARAISLNPNLERAGLGQMALEAARKSSASQPVLEAIGGGQENMSNPQAKGMGGLASNAAQQATQPQQQPSQGQPGQGLFLSNFIPLDLGKQINPEQKTKMLSDVASRGGDVEFTRKLIDDYNKGKINQNDLANANVDKQAANVQRMLGFEDQIRNKISEYVPENTSESEKNIYQNMIRPELESGKHKTFADAWQKVAADIDNFRKTKEAYVNRIPEPQITGVSPAGEEQLRKSAKPIMDVDPLAYNMLESAYISKGHSPVTPAKILKPLPQNVRGILSKAEDVRDLVYGPNLGSGDFTDRLMERNIEIANREQIQQIPKLSNELRKVWNEDLSLINIYTDLRKKGWSLPNINSLLDDVSDKFGKRQQAERAMLNQNIPIPTRYLSE